MEETIFVCEDSIEGILTGVYEAYALRKPHETIRLQTGAVQNYRLFAVYQQVEPDRQKSEKVIRTLYSRFGEAVCMQLEQAMVSYDDGKADAVYHTIVTGLSGRYQGCLMDHLSNRYVHKVFALSRNTGIEMHHLYGFLRFQELENGVLLAKYAPKNDITALLAPHFADRFPGEDFAIYDEKRQYYALHPKNRQWYLVRGGLPFADGQEEYTREEAEYQMLYRHFCHTITVAERKNTKLQRNMLPLRFRRHMVEFL